jgi:hypothetical protein
MCTGQARTCRPILSLHPLDLGWQWPETETWLANSPVHSFEQRMHVQSQVKKSALTSPQGVVFVWATSSTSRLGLSRKGQLFGLPLPTSECPIPSWDTKFKCETARRICDSCTNWNCPSPYLCETCDTVAPLSYWSTFQNITHALHRSSPVAKLEHTTIGFSSFLWSNLSPKFIGRTNLVKDLQSALGLLAPNPYMPAQPTSPIYIFHQSWIPDIWDSHCYHFTFNVVVRFFFRSLLRRFHALTQWVWRICRSWSIMISFGFQAEVSFQFFTHSWKHMSISRST